MHYIINGLICTHFCGLLLGTYIQQSHATLSCPDWPSCYGQLLLPFSHSGWQALQSQFPGININLSGAWKEMIQRYIIFLLSAIIIILGLWALFRKRKSAAQPLLVPWLLVLAIAAQIFLDKWAALHELSPITTVFHISINMTIFALLWWLILSMSKNIHPPSYHLRRCRPLATIALLLFIFQFFLGAWATVNHATMILQTIYQYSALLMIIYLFPFTLLLIAKPSYYSLRATAWTILLLLIMATALGIYSIYTTSPLAIIIIYNAVTALLFIAIITLLYKLYGRGWEKIL